MNGEMKNLDFRLADVHTDFDFLKTMEIPIIAGRDFNAELASDSSEAFIINEAAVKAGGWVNNDAAIGKKINYGGRTGYITGVVKDFHFESLKQEIAPVVFMITNGRNGSVVVKLDEAYKEKTIANVLARTDESEIYLRDWFENRLITEASTRSPWSTLRIWRGDRYRSDSPSSGITKP